MTVEEILSKKIQQDIDKEVLSKLFDAANVSEEDNIEAFKKSLQQLQERQSTELARMVGDMTNESIHKIDHDK